MNFKSKLVSVVGAGIIALSMVGGVGAQSATTQINVDVNKNSQGTVTASITSGTFSAVTTTFDQGGTSQGTIGLSVSDTRFTRAGWTVNLQGTDFTSGNNKIGVGSLKLQPKTVQVTAGDRDNMPQGQSVTMGNQGVTAMRAPQGSGSGIYTLDYDATIAVPANTAAGTYQSTITVTTSAAPN